MNVPGLSLLLHNNRSTKEDKTLYQIRREELGLSREKASELLETIPPERIERIESGRFTAYPDEVTKALAGGLFFYRKN